MKAIAAASILAAVPVKADAAELSASSGPDLVDSTVGTLIDVVKVRPLYYYNLTFPWLGADVQESYVVKPDSHGVLYCNNLDASWTFAKSKSGARTCLPHLQAAGSAVKTGLDYVGVGLSYAKNVRINASVLAHRVLAQWDCRCLRGYGCVYADWMITAGVQPSCSSCEGCHRYCCTLREERSRDSK